MNEREPVHGDLPEQGFSALLPEAGGDYGAMLDAMSNGVLIADAKTRRFFYCNPAACAMLGYPAAELLRLGVDDIHPAESLPVIHDAFQRLARQEMAVARELPVLGKHGKLLVCDIISRPITREGRACVLGIFHDITARKQAEADLKLRESYLRAIIENQPGLVWLKDAASRFLTVNQAFARSCGQQSPEALIGKTDLDIWPKELAEQYQADDARVMAGKQSVTVEEPIRDQGQTKWFETFKTPVLNEQGEILGTTGYARDVTPRKQMEAALREKQRLLTDIIENSGALVFVKDLEFRYQLVNYRWEEITGLRREMVLGRTDNELFPPATARQFRQNDMEVLAAGQPLEKEEVLDSPSGKRVFISIKFPWRDGDGRVAGVCGMITEITDRKRASEALAHSEQQLRAILSGAEEVIYTLSWTGEFLYVSPAWTHIVGHPVEEIVGRNFAPFVHPDDVAACRRFLQLVYTTGQPQRGVEYRVKTTRGDWVWFTSTGAVIRDAQQQPAYYVGVAIEITARKQAEEVLRQSEEKYREIFNATNEAFFVHDAVTGRILDVNAAMLRMYGYATKEEVLNNTMEAMIVDEPPYTADEIRRRVQQATEEGAQVFEWPAKKKDGSPFWVEVSVRRSQIGGAGRILAVVRDITERKRVEAERERLQLQLAQAQKMESVGRLAGGVAHDFNNMLGVILGHTDLALELLDSSHPLFSDLTEIRAAAERSAALTHQLLAFARKQTVAPKVINLNEDIEGMLKMLGRLIGEDIDLAWVPGAGLWLVNVDPSQIDQVLANLCVNARDAIANGGKITIETGNASFDAVYCAAHPGYLPGEYVRLAVSDNGCGMTREMQVHLFEPFFTTKGIGQGTGLGLATVYGIIRQNNGFITVYSEPDCGSMFTVYLPRHTAWTEPMRKEGSSEVGTRGHETILLVEDEPAILALTTTILERHGYAVLAAKTPGEAISLARAHLGAVHLLITDVVMPEMNGRELAKNLMSLYPDMKRLFMSGYTANVIAHHGVLDEGVNFIQKPFTPAALAGKIREVLGV